MLLLLHFLLRRTSFTAGITAAGLKSGGWKFSGKQPVISRHFDEEEGGRGVMAQFIG